MSANSNDQQGRSPTFPEPLGSSGKTEEVGLNTIVFSSASSAAVGLLSLARGAAYAPPLQLCATDDALGTNTPALLPPFSPVGAKGGLANPDSLSLRRSPPNPFRHSSRPDKTSSHDPMVFFGVSQDESGPGARTAVPTLPMPLVASRQQLEKLKRNVKRRTKTAFKQDDFVRASVGRKGGPDVRVWLLKRSTGGGMGGKFMNNEMRDVLIEYVQYVPKQSGCTYIVDLLEDKKQTALSAPLLVKILDSHVKSEAMHVQREGPGETGGSGGSSSAAREANAVISAPAFMVCECQHAKAVPWAEATTCYYGLREVDFAAAGLNSKEVGRRRCELRKKTQKRSKGANEQLDAKSVKAT